MAERDSVVYQYFDPNNIDSLTLVTFHLPEKIMRNWLNYRKKGGRFYKCSDLNKIYGMRPNILDSLLTYCKIATHSGQKKYNNHLPEIKKESVFETIQNNKQRININTADSITLRRLRGIGPVLSKRIIKYRNRLGGFYSKKQLLEVYGVEDSVLTMNHSLIRVAGPVRKININQCGFKDLIRHFYFDKSLTNAIINYRQQHGVYNSIQQLKNIKIINDSTYHRIKAYVKIKE